MDATYLSAADTAKLIRAALKRQFPKTKFSVVCRRGGNSISVDWRDGPTDGMVSAITNQYRGGGFDGMIDMAISHSSWLRPDGSACVASCAGTTGSGGGIPAQREWMPEAGCKLVRFCADYVFTRRQLSPAFAARMLARAVEKFGPLSLEVKVSTYDDTAHISGEFLDERRVYDMIGKFAILSA